MKPYYDQERNKILSRILGKPPAQLRTPAVAIVLCYAPCNCGRCVD